MESNTELELLRSWRSSPLKFVRDVFSIEPEPWQVDVLEAFPNQRKIAIKSGHGTGKSALLSWLIIHYVVCYAPAKVPCTAPSAHQLEDVLWAELRKWIGKAPLFVQEGLTLTRDKLSSSGDTFAVARTARKDNPDAFQGFHDENLLFIIDEASGVDDVIFEVAKGALSTPRARVIMTGNPTRASGYFFNAFNVNRDGWYCKTVSCYDSSRVDKMFIEDCIKEYGEDSNFFKVRILGEFPTTSNLQFISTDHVDMCMHYQAKGWENFPVQFGLDIARHGDDNSVLCIRQGRKVHDMIIYRIENLVDLAGRVAEKIKEWKPEQVAIDVVGIGWGVYDTLDKWKYSGVIEAIQAGNKAIEEGKYVNVRAEMWDKMKQAIKEGIELPNTERLKVDLTGIEYDFDNKLRLQLEKKSDMKARGLGSPDMAEALALTYARELNTDIDEKEFVNFIELGKEEKDGYFKGYI